jgi:uncharacterized protein
MGNPFQVEPRSLPLEGRRLTGSLPPAFFGLGEGDTIAPSGPLQYDLVIQRDDNDLLISGLLRAPFQLQCVRCLAPLQHDARMEDYRAEVPIENEANMDLTSLIREDILLTLPSYPRCADTDVTPRECLGEVWTASGAVGGERDSSSGDGAGVWDILDQFKR